MKEQVFDCLFIKLQKKNTKESMYVYVSIYQSNQLSIKEQNKPKQQLINKHKEVINNKICIAQSRTKYYKKKKQKSKKTIKQINKLRKNLIKYNKKIVSLVYYSKINKNLLSAKEKGYSEKVLRPLNQQQTSISHQNKSFLSNYYSKESHQEMQTNYFVYQKQEDDQPENLPLLPLQSKFSITSQMNPVKGLEMKRLISVNQDGAAEPYIDLGNQNYINNYFGTGLTNQNSFVLDLNNQQSYIPNYNNQSSMINDMFLQNNQSYIDSGIQGQLSNAIQQNQRQNQTFYPQQQQQQQNYFVNSNIGGNTNSSNNSLNQQVFSSQQNQNANLIFKNPDQFSTYVQQQPSNGQNIIGSNGSNSNTGLNTYNNNHISNYNFQGQLQNKQIQQHGNQYQEIQEKKEEIEQDGQNVGYDHQFQAPKPYYQQQISANNPNLINFVISQNHQDYIDRNEAEYIPEHKSHHGDEEESNNFSQNNDGNGQVYQDEDDDYRDNMDSHTRHKTEWPSRPKGQTKYQQCRHRNIFKNFGNIFRKFVNFHNHFTEKALSNLDNNQESLKNFQRWLKKEIRLENKKDFIEGWTIWKDEDEQIRQFKIILKDLSKDFFQDYILIYLLNSKLQDLEIHLRSIGPCLAAINQPSILYKFRPI